MKLVDVTRENWIPVVLLTTNNKVTVQGSREPYDAGATPTLCEDFVASNALSIVQSVFEDGWTIKAIQQDEEPVGFTMYGYSHSNNCYELCRLMIDRKHQGKGFGTQAIRLILEEMKKMDGCREVYLSTDPMNVVGKHVYEKVGFVPQNQLWGDEEVYKISL